MKRKIFYLSIGVVCLAILASCTTFKVSGVEVHQAATEGTVVGDFSIDIKVNKFLGGSAGKNLFNLTSDATDPKIIDAIRKEVTNRGGTAAINIKIDQNASFFNLLLNFITFNLYAPATVHVTGTIIK